MSQTTSNLITYEDFDCCPLCGSKHFSKLPFIQLPAGVLGIQ